MDPMVAQSLKSTSWPAWVMVSATHSATAWVLPVSEP